MRKPKDPRIQKNAAGLRKNQTDAENALWKELRLHEMDGVHFHRQHTIGHYVADFCSPARKLVIEVDGGHHLERGEYDARRTEFLKGQGYQLLRFWDHQVLFEMDEMLQVIFDTLRGVGE